jgi:uncharacterized membrane protein YtjA (UPF0391 family)
MAYQLLILIVREPHCSGERRKNLMLSWSMTFLIIGLIAAVLGMTGIAGAATQIAWVLFVLFIVLFLISLVTGSRRTG